MLEIGKTYTTKEFKQALKITDYVWENRKGELLEHIKLYIDYRITQLSNNRIGYIIME